MILGADKPPARAPQPTTQTGRILLATWRRKPPDIEAQNQRSMLKIRDSVLSGISASGNWSHPCPKMRRLTVAFTCCSPHPIPTCHSEVPKLAPRHLESRARAGLPATGASRENPAHRPGRGRQIPRYNIARDGDRLFRQRLVKIRTDYDLAATSMSLRHARGPASRANQP
jgi:hypothetical protein